MESLQHFLYDAMKRKWHNKFYFEMFFEFLWQFRKKNKKRKTGDLFLKKGDEHVYTNRN